MHLDGFMGMAYASNVHDMVVKGLCAEHKAALGHELPPGSVPAPKMMADTLLQRAAGVSTIPARQRWEIDSDLRERFIAVYAHFIYDQVNPRGTEEAPAFKAREVDPDDTLLN
ncbi:hypothetical protein IT087_00050 [Candidatus Uhrbacteria bacterium]|nr:hypothetical protein [Candidatus Uhrbacteria bacterium]